MWAAAISLNTIPCTFIYSVAILIYNEGGLAGIPVVKNLIGAVGLTCYCWGTTVILGTSLHLLFPLRHFSSLANIHRDHGKEIHGWKAIAVSMIGAIFATTVCIFTLGLFE